MGVRSNKDTALKIPRILGSDETGRDTLGYLNFNNVNPGIADDDLLAVGKKIGNIQSFPVKSIERQDVCTLV
ncbi:DUF1659 domain-containing protein [Selenomonas ruminantium]|uniref:DUF1659 domain-containing protein n=1 Tax=Selenomonas ruminantium TaxID=971 RepID=A0A1H3VQ63_SELRU|nr:DUF1659 domain-containing protein [Selenomonas ruminantium]SDZ76899.1 Protein of unknown function [Selenomonas ruminantium]